MSQDDLSSFNAPASHQPNPAPGRKALPRWLIPFFILDAFIVIAVLYWAFGGKTSTDDVDDGPGVVQEVRGEPIDVMAVGGATEQQASAAAPSGDSEPFASLEDESWGDFDDDTTFAEAATSAVATPVASSKLPPEGLDMLFGTQQQLPRPTIDRSENKSYTPASFEDIGDWKYERNWSGVGVGGGGGTAKIPTNVRAWHNRKIAILGYMQPLDLDEENRVKSFMLMRNQAACCYGAPITLADWIEVTAPAGTTFEAMLHKPITVLGTLDVGEKLVDNFVVSVFRMQPDQVLPPGETP